MRRTRLSSAEVAARPGLGPWRVIGDWLSARFEDASFAGAARFAVEVAEAADAADHHPDIDLRYPGAVEVWITTHDRGGLTEFDLALAATISSLAAQRGLIPAVTPAGLAATVLHAADPATVVPFWQAVLDGRSSPTATPAPAPGAWRVSGKGRAGPVIVITAADPAEVPPAGTSTVCVRLELTVAHDHVEDRVRAALAAGGSLLPEGAGGSRRLADPEGNMAVLHTTAPGATSASG